jgi:acid phosphatase
MGEQSDPFEAYALKWYLPLSPLLRTVPMYPVVGNHDVEPAAFFEGMPFYYRAFPGFPDPRLPASLHEGRNQWYAFGAGNLQFLMLDTQTFYGEPGREEQDQWLAERLSDPAFAYSIGVLHVPPYSSGGLHSGDGIPVERFWVPLFVEGHVPLVLSGHSHNYERLEVNGVTYIVSGGGSSALYGEGVTHPFSRVFAVQTHFVLLEVYADRIDLTAIALGDAVIDQVTIPLG